MDGNNGLIWPHVGTNGHMYGTNGLMYDTNGLMLAIMALYMTLFPHVGNNGPMLHVFH